MENLTLSHLKELAQQNQMPSISIFMPTHRAGPETQQDPIRFKNLLRDAEEWLSDSGMNSRQAAEFLQPAQALQDDTNFWRHQYEGLVIYIAAGDFHVFRLPFAVDEMMVVPRSYYIKPVLPLFTNDGHFYILAISQDEVRLFEGTRHSVGQLDLPESTPASLDEALKFDDPEKQLQFHTGSAQGGTRDAMFHGHGGGEEEQKIRIERYLNLVDAGLRDIFHDQRAPLVLAGVDYLLPIYRKVSEYGNIMPEGITGSPEHLSAQELQQEAWPLVEPYFRQEWNTVIDQYRQLAGTGKATDNIEEIVAAAVAGRVEALVLDPDAQRWGKFDTDSGKVLHLQQEQSQEDDVPLLDFAALQTLQNGGKVYAPLQPDMPTAAPIAAILRY